jgi:hypothetical protein
VRREGATLGPARDGRRRPAFVVVRAPRRRLHGPCSARTAGESAPFESDRRRALPGRVVLLAKRGCLASGAASPAFTLRRASAAAAPRDCVCPTPVTRRACPGARSLPLGMESSSRCAFSEIRVERAGFGRWRCRRARRDFTGRGCSSGCSLPRAKPVGCRRSAGTRPQLAPSRRAPSWLGGPGIPRSKHGGSVHRCATLACVPG